jgi:hypothetical protein
MNRMDDLRQCVTPLDRFLHADVGEDRKGNPVTVLSTFARLGLDPWEEASELSKLTRENARLRLCALLERFRDVAISGDGFGATTQRLIDLLPQSTVHAERDRVLSSPNVVARELGPFLAVVAVLFLLLQAFFADAGGSED